MPVSKMHRAMIVSLRGWILLLDTPDAGCV